MDTQDYTTDNHPELIPTVKSSFTTNTKNTALYPNGIIALEHDYFQGGVNLFTQAFYPQIIADGYTYIPLTTCLGVANWSFSQGVSVQASVNGTAVNTNASTAATGGNGNGNSGSAGSKMNALVGGLVVLCLVITVSTIVL